MPIYGHFGQGCIHTRMSYDFRSVEGVKAYREFIERAADIVLEFGGSLSGEHGDGQSRGALLPKMFGPELMEAFREFKALWDPDNRMNPGKMMGTPDDPRIYQPEEKLRIGPGYEPARPAHTLRVSRRRRRLLECSDALRRRGRLPQDDQRHHVSQLHGYARGAALHARPRAPAVGADAERRRCRTSGRTSRCTRRWTSASPARRARVSARCAWTWPPTKPSSSRSTTQTSCTRCHTISSALWIAGRGWHPSRHALANAALMVPGMESLAKRIADVAPERTLPRFASRSFLKQQDRPAKNESDQKTVLLWPDTWNNYLQPQVLDAAARVLRSAGFRVVFPRRHICCGRPLYDFGFLDQARRYLDDVLSRLAPQIDAGMPFIVLEPSCASVFLEELRNFYPKNERAQRLAGQTYLLADFLAEHAPEWQPPSLTDRKIVLHGHCHHKAVFNMKKERALLEQTGAQVTMLDSGCCGMAGPFGFERDKYTVSQTLGERVLLPAVRAADHDTLIVTDGFSCREQIAQGTSRRAVHVAEVLAPESV